MYSTDIFDRGFYSFGDEGSYTFNENVKFKPFTSLYTPEHHEYFLDNQSRINDQGANKKAWTPSRDSTPQKFVTDSVVAAKPSSSSTKPKAVVKPRPAQSKCADAPSGLFSGSATRMGVTVSGTVFVNPVNSESGLM